MRRNAAHWVEVSEHVWRYRRDQFKPAEAKELLERTAALRDQRKVADIDKLKRLIEQLEASLRKVGGKIYPKTAFVDNVEFFLMAAIVILGFRAYFAKAFEIPTNSMWPTYYGMTPEVFARPADVPGLPVEAARVVLFGAWPRRFDAPADGEILIPVGGSQTARGVIHYRVAAGRSWLVLPADVREYTLLVGGQPVKIQVPLDFDFDWAVYDAFLNEGKPYSPQNLAAELQKRAQTNGVDLQMVDGDPVHYVHIGRTVRAGERFFAFDQMTGDKLVVDRFSYNFVRPPVGSGIVFRTVHIPGIGADEYFVKRLVGTPGDVIEIKEPAIYRNGRPITGSEVFDLNARRTGLYRGYFNPTAADNALYLLDGESLTVPAHSFLGLGDNSGNSLDGRYWGFVPAKDVAGRPLFVYYPFTKRWGPAK